MSPEERAARFFLDNTIFDRETLDAQLATMPKVPISNPVYELTNTDANRYNNVPCLQSTRVQLVPIPGEAAYIHANWVSLRATKTSRYIATQCPLPNTLSQFFRMVREQGIKSIINISKPEEITKGRSFCYWPTTTGEGLRLANGASVRLISDNFDERIRCDVISLLHYLNDQDIQPHAFRIYRYRAWPDFGVPEQPMTLLRLLNDIRHENGHAPTPVAIHCSAGLGRTGTLLAIEDAIRAINKGCKATIPKIVENIRRQRPQSVQTKAQYRYIFAATALYSNAMLDNGRTLQVMRIYNELVPPVQQKPQQQTPSQMPPVPPAPTQQQYQQQPQQQTPSQMPTNQESLARIPGMFQRPPPPPQQ